MTDDLGQELPLHNIRFEPRVASILKEIASVASDSGIPCFLVGGCIRDAILNRPVLDIDIVIDQMNSSGIDSERFAVLASGSLKGSHPVCFDRFGTHHFVVSGRGGRVEIEIVSAPLSVTHDFEVGDTSDVMRRDFTVNSLMLGLNVSNFGRLYDLTGSGLEDTNNRLLRCPLNPSETFTDDPIRMLRAVRLSCTLDFRVDGSARDFIKQNPQLVANSAAERQRKELELILLSDKPAEGFRMLHELGLLRVIMPGFDSMEGTMQDKRFHSEDVLNHTFSVLANVEQKDLTTRLAALFHDTGKPLAKRPKGERVVFYGHEHIGAEMASRILRSLKFPNSIVKEVAGLVRNHMINYSEEWTDAAIRRLIKRIGPLLPKQLNLYEADIAALTDAGGLLESARELRRRIETIDEKEHVAKIESPLNGREICELLEINPGRLVGEYKARLLDAVLSGELENEKGAASEYLRELHARGI
ncbi:MAG: HDIG domain-containing protein [Candidatus Coatesbacteria bacterium]|nr:HDIG domain-containing protein [Candidatus Coatesbacteria bacterium]